jgi:hypothetical protein
MCLPSPRRDVSSLRSSAWSSPNRWRCAIALAAILASTGCIELGACLLTGYATAVGHDKDRERRQQERRRILAAHQGEDAWPCPPGCADGFVCTIAGADVGGVCRARCVVGHDDCDATLSCAAIEDDGDGAGACIPDATP